MADKKIDPRVLAQPDSGFRFPEGLTFSQDMTSAELRILILGWLDQARAAIINSGSVATLRHATFRAQALTIDLSAYEIAKHLKYERRVRRIVKQELAEDEARISANRATSQKESAQ